MNHHRLWRRPVDKLGLLDSFSSVVVIWLGRMGQRREVVNVTHANRTAYSHAGAAGTLEWHPVVQDGCTKSFRWRGCSAAACVVVGLAPGAMLQAVQAAALLAENTTQGRRSGTGLGGGCGKEGHGHLDGRVVHGEQLESTDQIGSQSENHMLFPQKIKRSGAHAQYALCKLLACVAAATRCDFCAKGGCFSYLVERMRVR